VIPQITGRRRSWLASNAERRGGRAVLNEHIRSWRSDVVPRPQPDDLD
jgi:hypothetical protein